MRVAIIHPWITAWRGGERVLAELLDLFPSADVFTHVFDARVVPAGFPSHRISQTSIGSLPFAPKLYRAYLPLMPAALESLDLNDYDLIVSCESGPAKGVIPAPGVPHICYCHSVMRYLWDQRSIYERRVPKMLRPAVRTLARRMRIWDVVTANRVTRFVANSGFVQARIRSYYRRDATVIHPPVPLDGLRPRPDDVGDFFLFLGQLVPYKRADIAVEAANRLDVPLKVIGIGPELRRLKALAGRSVEFLGHATRETVVDHLQRCRALLHPGVEDFGLVPVEAMACGRPVLAYGQGGVLDTVDPDISGLFFHRQDAEALCEAMREFARRERSFEPERIAEGARRFAPEHFRSRFMELVEAVSEAR